MQNQEHMYNTPEHTSSGENQINTDPREQALPQDSMDRSYEEGYSGGTRDIWSEGQKLQPMPKSEKSMGRLLVVIALLGVAFLAGSHFANISSWLSGIGIAVLVIIGLSVLASNWRVVTIPMPARTFQVQEHARLTIHNSAGRVAIRRGEEGMISVNATKRASGIGIDPESMQVRYDQFTNALNITTDVNWNIFQFGMRSIDFEITVPANCDIQLENGAGRVAVEGMNGNVRVRTGSGSLVVRDVEGQIAMKTGSGHIEGSHLAGRIELRTGSSRIEVQDIRGQIDLHTGSSRIEGSNLRGQVKAQTGSGRIEIRQSALTGDSLLKTGSSAIEFDGSLDPSSSTKMKTGSGGIRLSLPASATFSLDAKTGSGGVHNEFGSKDRGNGLRAQLKLRTGSGGIHITRNGTY